MTSESVILAQLIDILSVCVCFKQKTAYDVRISDWSSDVCSSDLLMRFVTGQYSNGLPMAMMIGYVMNGNNVRARQGLRRAMKARLGSLGLTGEQDHLSPAGAPTRFCSTHTCRPGHSIEVEHLLLPWP